MAPNLQLGPSQASPSETAMFNLLKANLEFPAGSTVKAKKLVDDIIFIYTSTEDSPYCSWQLWPMVVALAACIPPDHEWQTSLVEALHLLRQLDDSVAKDDSKVGISKADVPMPLAKIDKFLPQIGAIQQTTRPPHDDYRVLAWISQYAHNHHHSQNRY